MGVVGDIVGDRSDLGLHRGKAPEFEVEAFDVIGNADRDALPAIRPDRRAAPLGQRPVVLDDALQQFPGQVEALEFGIAMLQRGHNAQRLRIVVEAAMVLQAGIERALPGMAERGVAEVVGERQGLREVLVQPELPGQRTGDLRHLEGMRQPGAVVVALVEHEHLGLVLQPAEGRGMDHPVAIPPERAAGAARRLRKQPATARVGVAGKGRPRGSHSDGHGNLILIRLIPLTPALNYGERAIPNELGMTPGETAMSTAITVSERAARRIGEILKGEGDGAMLRISVEGGGCSGFQYKFDVDHAKAEDDLVIAREGAVVLVDPASVPFLAGSEVDFVDDLIGASFRVVNPNATASCGCGTSFSI